MTENQILALVSSLAVLFFLISRNWRSFPREGLLWKIALWLAIFLGVGLFYTAFGPF
jgi:CHASE2 domain-containing sensor protein